MRVIVSDGVFDGSVPAPNIFALLDFAFRGRHRVLVEPGPFFKDWRDSLTDTAREPYDAALDMSLDLESREPSDHERRVGTGQGCISIDEALEQLGRPFLLFVENDVSDRGFLEAIASPPHRERLRQMHAKGWITFRSRGGVSHIKSLLTEVLSEFPDDGWRMFAVFDSDAAAPKEPHADARSVAQRCDERTIRYRMLERRAIENYLTRHALSAWNSGQPRAEVHRGGIDALYGEWFSKRPERRYHFVMKRGFRGMDPLHSMYDGIPMEVKKALNQGFGSDVAMAFSPSSIREVDLRAEGSWDELSEMIEALVRSMR